MRSVKDIVFTVAVCVVIASGLALALIDDIVPEFDMPKESSVEGRKYVRLGDVVKKSIVNGDFQAEYEQYAADSVPFKENVVTFSASLQRAAIKTAAVPLGYKMYPTFYSSGYYELPEHGIVMAKPAKAPGKNSSSIKNLNAWTNTLSEAAKAHTNTRFTVNLALQVHQDDSNPLYDEMTSFKRMNAKWVQSEWSKRLDESVRLIVDDVKDEEEVVREWYSNDHHWTLHRALQSYNRLADELDWKHVDWDDGKTVEPIDSWYGSYARRGLDFDISSKFVDLTTDFSSLEYRSFGKNGEGDIITLGAREDILSGKAPAAKIDKYNANSAYYGNTPTVVRNSSADNDKVCLVIGDSMSYCLRRYIAMNYEKSVFVFPGNSKVSQSLSDLIDDYSADDVVVLTHAQSPDFIADMSPDFLTGD